MAGLTTGELRARVVALCPELAGLPVSPLERWELSFGPLWVKRDDLLGEGGTKVRKLLTELSEVRWRGGGRVLTVGYLDSNHALATARWGIKHGIPVELLLVGRESEDPSRAALLRSLAPTKMHRSFWGVFFGMLWRLFLAWLRRERLMIFPAGGTTYRSTAVVAWSVAEVVEQFAALGEKVPEHWAVAVGSGGTLAGLLAGASGLGLKVQIHGVAASTRLVGPKWVSRLANRALRLLGLSASVSAAEVDLAFDLLGKGHARPPANVQQILRELADQGHELDPIFTARALAWIKSQARPGQSWLFWHTGVAVK